MLEVLQFYVSSFWVWLGLTIGLGLVSDGIVRLLVGLAAAVRGAPIRFSNDQ